MSDSVGSEGEVWTLAEERDSWRRVAERLEAEKREAVSEGDRLAEALREDRHVVEFREDGWGLQHPVLCRPDLIGCPVNRALQALNHPTVLGRFRVHLEDGHLRYANYTDGDDPVIAALARWDALKGGQDG